MKKIKQEIISDTVAIFKDVSKERYFLIPSEDPDNVIDNFNNHTQIIQFQNGSIKENKVNGITEASLITILIDRFEYFQNHSNLPCCENEYILDCLYQILFNINKRTKDRISRNVEGFNKK